MLLSRAPSLFAVAGVVLSMALLGSGAFAGTKDGGGGDETDAQVDVIRGKLMGWISQNGYKSLSYPAGVDAATYAREMSAWLQPQYVVLSAVTDSQEAAARGRDDEQKVEIQGDARPCRGFMSARDGHPHIVCSVERFAHASGLSRFRWVHHEYARLAGIESGDDPKQGFFFSDQLTDFLEQKTVFRLAIRKNNLGQQLRQASADLAAALSFDVPFPFHLSGDDNKAKHALRIKTEGLVRGSASDALCPSQVLIRQSMNDGSRLEYWDFNINPRQFSRLYVMQSVLPSHPLARFTDYRDGVAQGGEPPSVYVEGLNASSSDSVYVRQPGSHRWIQTAGVSADSHVPTIVIPIGSASNGESRLSEALLRFLCFYADPNDPAQAGMARRCGLLGIEPLCAIPRAEAQVSLP